MIRRCKVRAARALVHDVQQEHPLLAVFLELLEILALHGRRALDVEERNLVLSKGLGDLSGEIGEVNKTRTRSSLEMVCLP